MDWNKSFTYKGKKARLICKDRISKEHISYIILYTGRSGEEVIGSCDEWGRDYSGGQVVENVKTVVKGWYILDGRNMKLYTPGDVYFSCKEEAEKYLKEKFTSESQQYFTPVYMEWEE